MQGSYVYPYYTCILIFPKMIYQIVISLMKSALSVIYNKGYGIWLSPEKEQDDTFTSKQLIIIVSGLCYHKSSGWIIPSNYQTWKTSQFINTLFHTAFTKLIFIKMNSIQIIVRADSDP